MKDKSMSAGMILMLLTLAATQFLAGCGDFWEAPTSTGTTATTTTLTASPTTAATGSSVTLTAAVAASAGTGTPTGTVTFYSGTTSLGTGTLSAGTATLDVTFNTAATLSLTAVYGGDSTFATSTSTAVSFTVTGLTTTTTTLAASPSSPGANELVTLTSTVTPTSGTGTPTGTVTFYNSTTSVGTGTLSSGTATLDTSFSPANTYSLTAVYSGDTSYSTSTSTALSLIVGSAPTPMNCGLQDNTNSVYAIAAIAYSINGDYTLTSPFITVSTADESALCAETSGTAVTVSIPTIVSSSVGSNSGDSSYSGTNAAVLAYGSSATVASGGSIAITGGDITTTGNFGNGAFASGDGATISLSGTTITTGSSTDSTAGANASGVVAAAGGTVTATTGTITANNAEAAVVEGASSVTINGSILNSTLGNYRGILLYQSASSVGTSSFTMTGGSLTYTCDETTTASCANGVPASGTSVPATLFAVADTTAAISLTDVTVSNDTPTTTDSNGTLLEVEALNGSSASSNATFTATGEDLTGDVIVDSISSAALTLNQDSLSVATTLTGAINNANSGGTVGLTLDSTSSWTVTATSYLTTLTGLSINGSNVVSNIDGNGHCVYYSGNINGASSTTTYTLSGTNAGYLAPVGTTGLTCD